MSSFGSFWPLINKSRSTHEQACMRHRDKKSPQSDAVTYCGDSAVVCRVLRFSTFFRRPTVYRFQKTFFLPLLYPFSFISIVNAFDDIFHPPTFLPIGQKCKLKAENSLWYACVLFLEVSNWERKLAIGGSKTFEEEYRWRRQKIAWVWSFDQAIKTSRLSKSVMEPTTF